MPPKPTARVNSCQGLVGANPRDDNVGVPGGPGGGRGRAAAAVLLLGAATPTFSHG